VPFQDRASIGGAISVDAAGARRLGYGTWRDRVIGITVVNDRGELCSAGGRVVKNVAGYDLGKLYTGSLGSFGIITQVTLKLQPKPEAQTWVSLEVSLNDLPKSLDQLNDSETRPVAIDLVSSEDRSGKFDLAVLYEDNAEAVKWQVAQLASELTFAAVTTRSPDWFEGLMTSPRMIECYFRLIAAIPPSAVAGIIKDVFRDQLLIHAHPQSGIVRLGLISTTQGEAVAFARRVLALTTAFGGNSIVRRCLPAWKSSLPIWGQPSASLELMKKLKHEFDPKNILNPGRTAIG
jgi:glycolate oxidase FAD binding subunit